MSNIVLYAIFWSIGIACGVLMAALFVSKSDVDDYEEGYADGYNDGKNKMRDNIDNLCSHCSYRGRAE